MLLGILLASSSELQRALRYAAAAHALGHQVEVFVTFEATEALASKEAAALVEVARVVACAQTVKAARITPHPKVELGSQFDHAELARRADRFLALT